MSERIKVVLEYDESTGDICDREGTTVACWKGLVPFENDELSTVLASAVSKFTVSDMICLKNAGFTAADILMLNNIDEYEL